MAKDLDKKIDVFSQKSFGGSKVEYINDTITHSLTPDAYCIQVITACSFDQGTSLEVENAAGILTDGLPAGIYFIKASSIKLASGSLLVYKYA